MDCADVFLYSIGIAVILLLVYTFPYFPYFYAESFLGKLVPVFQKWFAKSKIQTLQGSDDAIQPEDPILEKVSQYSASWWSDENIYKLERRAIFSKVGATL